MAVYALKKLLGTVDRADAQLLPLSRPTRIGERVYRAHVDELYNDSAKGQLDFAGSGRWPETRSNGGSLTSSADVAAEGLVVSSTLNRSQVTVHSKCHPIVGRSKRHHSSISSISSFSRGRRPHSRQQGATVPVSTSPKSFQQVSRAKQSSDSVSLGTSRVAADITALHRLFCDSSRQ